MLPTIAAPTQRSDTVSKQQQPVVEIENLSRAQEELTTEEAADARGGLATVKYYTCGFFGGCWEVDGPDGGGGSAYGWQDFIGDVTP
jgi:hypothetical protein